MIRRKKKEKRKHKAKERKEEKQDRQFTCHIILSHFHATISAVEKQ
jgi:hypothetical protein